MGWWRTSRWASLQRLIGLLILLSAPSAAQEPEPFIPPDRQPITAENIDQLELLGTVGRGWQYRDVAWSPDGETIAVASMGGFAIYSADDLFSPPQFFQNPYPNVIPVKVEFSADGRFLALVNHDGTAAFWETSRWMPLESTSIKPFSPSTSGEPLVVSGFPASFRDITVSPDQTMMAIYLDHETCIPGSALQLWSIPEGQQIAVACSRGNVEAFSPNNRFLLAHYLFGANGSVEIWDIEHWLSEGTPNPVVLKGLTMPVEGAVFSPDGTQLAVVGWLHDTHGPGSDRESELSVWTLTDERPHAVFLRSPITEAQLDPDGEWLYFQGQLWNLFSGKPLRLTEHTLWEISPDFRYAVAYPPENWSIRYWKGETESCDYGPCAGREIRHPLQPVIWDIVTGGRVTSGYEPRREDLALWQRELSKIGAGVFVGATPNRDLIVTEGAGFAYLWGIPDKIEP